MIAVGDIVVRAGRKTMRRTLSKVGKKTDTDVLYDDDGKQLGYEEEYRKATIKDWVMSYSNNDEFFCTVLRYLAKKEFLHERFLKRVYQDNIDLLPNNYVIK